LKEEFVIDDNSHEIGLPDWGKIKKEKEKELKIYCKNCARGEKIISAYDIGKALEYHLSLNNNDYFICESCGKYNFMFNRGKNFCNYCESKGVYYNYRTSLRINESYHNIAFGEKKRIMNIRNVIYKLKRIFVDTFWFHVFLFL